MEIHRIVSIGHHPPQYFTEKKFSEKAGTPLTSEINLDLLKFMFCILFLTYM